MEIMELILTHPLNKRKKYSEMLNISFFTGWKILHLQGIPELQLMLVDVENLKPFDLLPHNISLYIITYISI